MGLAWKARYSEWSWEKENGILRVVGSYRKVPGSRENSGPWFLTVLRGDRQAGLKEKKWLDSFPVPGIKGDPTLVVPFFTGNRGCFAPCLCRPATHLQCGGGRDL